MKKYITMIQNIKTEDDLKVTEITICQATSSYKLSWEQFMKLKAMLDQVRAVKGFKWGARR